MVPAQSALKFMANLNDHLPMSATIAAAKEQFCQIVADAEAGRETIITKRNRPRRQGGADGSSSGETLRRME